MDNVSWQSLALSGNNISLSSLSFSCSSKESWSESLTPRTEKWKKSVCCLLSCHLYFPRWMRGTASFFKLPARESD